MNDTKYSQARQLKSSIKAFDDMIDRVNAYGLHFILKDGGVTINEAVLKSMVGATDYDTAVADAKTTIITALTTKRDNYQTQFDAL